MSLGMNRCNCSYHEAGFKRGKPGNKRENKKVDFIEDSEWPDSFLFPPPVLFCSF